MCEDVKAKKEAGVISGKLQRGNGTSRVRGLDPWDLAAPPSPMQHLSWLMPLPSPA